MSTSRRQFSVPRCHFLGKRELAIIACPLEEQAPHRLLRSARHFPPRQRIAPGPSRVQLPHSQPILLPLILRRSLLAPGLPDLLRALPEPPLPQVQPQPLPRPPDWKNNY